MDVAKITCDCVWALSVRARMQDDAAFFFTPTSNPKRRTRMCWSFSSSSCSSYPYHYPPSRRRLILFCLLWLSFFLGALFGLGLSSFSLPPSSFSFSPIKALSLFW